MDEQIAKINILNKIAAMPPKLEVVFDIHAIENLRSLYGDTTAEETIDFIVEKAKSVLLKKRC